MYSALAGACKESITRTGKKRKTGQRDDGLEQGPGAAGRERSVRKTVTPGDKIGLAIILVGLTGGVINLIKFIKATKRREIPQAKAILSMQYGHGYGCTYHGWGL